MRLLATTAIAALGLTAAAVTTAEAEQTFVDIGLTYSTLDAEGEDLTSTSLSGSAGYQYGAISIIGSIGYTGIDFGEGDEADVTGIGLQLGYAVTPQIEVGLAVARTEFDGEDASIYYELSGTYDAGPYWVTLRAGQDEDNVFAGGDTFYGITGGYDFGQGTEVALSYYDSDGEDTEAFTLLNVLHQTETLEIEGSVLKLDSDTTFIQTSTAYGVTPQIDALFDLDVYSFDGGDERITGIGIGAGYEVTPGVNVFAKLTRLTSEEFDEDVDGFSIGVTYKTGDRSLRDAGTFDTVVDPLLFDGGVLFF